MNERIVIRGGLVADGSGLAAREADVAIEGGRITTVGEVTQREGDHVIDATSRVVMPGFIDTHSHGEGRVFDAEVQLAMLRQGVTTIIGGQDGVSYAPGDGSYGTDYFGALNGEHPTYRGTTVADLLETYDGTSPINVGYLIPAGNVRHAVAGYRAGAADAAERARMVELVSEGMRDGALGLSTGLDYVPGIFQDTDELTLLVQAAAAQGGLYVTHMRGGYEANSRIGMEEVQRIALATGAAVHISHLHGPSTLLRELLDELTASGVDVSFDAYPYRRGCTLAAMPLLPPELLSGERAEVVAALRSEQTRERLLTEWFPSLAKSPILGAEWPDNFTLAHVGAPEWAWTEGLTVRAAAARAEISEAHLILELLVAAELQVSCVVAVREARSYDDMAKIVTDPRHAVGSDGIWVGRFTHPRARGTFPRFLSLFHRERGDYTIAQAAVHLAGLAAARFGLVDRGQIRPGFIADIAIVDAATVQAGASYDAPLAHATGIDDVLVAGIPVLRDGELTGATPGCGIRRMGGV